MKLLVLAPCLPCPPDHGRSKRMYYLYGPLADKHEVWWVSPRESDTESDLHQTERMFTKVIAVAEAPQSSEASGQGTRLRASNGGIGRYLGHPFPVYDEVCEALSCLRDGSFDAVIVDHEMMAGYIRHTVKDIPWLLNTHNVPSVLAQRTWPHIKSRWHRVLAWLEYRSVLKFEADTFPLFDAVAAVSETERCMLTKRFPNGKAFCVPNGVSSDLAQIHVPSEPSGKVLNFTGTFNYRPNRDAIKFFCSAIFPRILRRDGSVELQLVGKGSDSFARTLAPGLPVTGLGYVDDALEPLGRCAAVIAPFRLGAGTRIKILEAIALGRPVIATTVGAEGIDLDASSGLLIADDPSDFAEKTLLALNDPGIMDSAQKTGRTRVFADYSWESSAGKLAELIDSVVRSDSGQLENGVMNPTGSENGLVSWPPAENEAGRPDCIPTFSVVMPLYNKAPYVRRAVESVLKQTLADFELLVVDDGSTDGGAQVVEEFLDSRIRLIKQANAGASAARNRGIAAARAELIAFLDADDEWLSGFLETISGLRAEYPQAAVLATAYRRISPERENTTSRFRWTRSSKSSGTHIIDFFDDECPYETRVHTCSLVVRKDAILAVGGFPEGIVQSEDIDTWFRLALRYQTAWSSDFRVIYHMDAGEHLWAGGKYWYYGAKPTMASLRRFITERGGSEGVPGNVYSFVEGYLRSQVEVNLLAGDSRTVRQIVRDLRSINRCGPSDRAAHLLSFLPNRLYQGLWRLGRVIRGRSPKMREFRNVCRGRSCA